MKNEIPLIIVSCLISFWARTNLSAGVTTETKIYKTHGIARFDDIKYPLSFEHFDYVNPEAPKGGEISTIGIGAFDSLNPYAQSGTLPIDIPPLNYFSPGFLALNETLMVGSGPYAPIADEPKSAYGLIAESVEYPENNRWIIFNLRPEARFHDGHPITADDVLFSYHELKTSGPIKYQLQLKPITSVIKLGKLRVQFIFAESGPRNQLFSAAEIPVLPAHYWQPKQLGQSTLIPPLGSGPYKVSNIKPGLSISFTRVKDYWGKELPVNKGKYNIDTITVFYYKDISTAFEAFKGGHHDIYIEPTAKNWATGYQFPAVKKGLIKQVELPTQVIPGSPMIFFNTRRKPFDDIRVREALGYFLDFEWTNRTVFFNAYTRSNSYFPGSVYAAKGIPSKEEQKLLNPWKKYLPTELFKSPFTLPINSGDGNIRPNQIKALRLLTAAGWTLKNNKLFNKQGQQLAFEILSYSHIADHLIIPFKKNLASTGIEMNYRVVDSSSYFQRLRNLDFDAIGHGRISSLSVGNELIRYFHSQNTNIHNTENLAGINNPVVDYLLNLLPRVNTQKELETLISSLDRVLLWNYYGIPLFYYNKVRIACKRQLQWPAITTPLPMILSTWWVKSSGT